MEKLKNWFQSWRAHDRSTQQIEVGDIPENFNFSTLLRFLGPGMLVSIAYLDPGNLLSDIQSGAAFNYQLIWILLMSTFLGFLMQTLSSRLGIVTGKHLAVMCREEYGNQTLMTYSLWFLSEIAIIASDIPEVVGSAFGFYLLFGIPLWAGVLIVSVNTFILLGVQYFGIRKLEILITFLIGIIGLCFLIESFISPVAWVHSTCPAENNWTNVVNCSLANYCPSDYCGTVWTGFVPYIAFDVKMLLIATSLIGAVVMPHNLFLHSALVLSRKIDRSRPSQITWADRYSIIECGISIGISGIINLCVILVAASVFYPNASNNYSVYEDLSEIGFTEASLLLDSTLGGTLASTLFGIALLASGQSSTITGTYAGQFVMEGFIELKVQLWLRNIITRSVAIVPSLVICLLAGKGGANTLIIVSSVILSFQLPFALIPLLRFTSSEQIMGMHKNSYLLQIVCTILTIIVLTANTFLICVTIYDSLDGVAFVFASIIGSIIAIGYFGAIGYLAVRPIHAHGYTIAATSTDEEGILMNDITDDDEDDEFSDISEEFDMY